jgi:hypothetical protein
VAVLIVISMPSAKNVNFYKYYVTRYGSKTIKFVDYLTNKEKMHCNKIKTFALFSIYLLGLTLKAQTASIAAGGDASSNQGIIAYSIGQVVYTINHGPTGSVAQGVQQAFEISVAAELQEIRGINLTVHAYPNPTIDFLNLKIENYHNKNLSYQLIDINGKLLESEKLIDNQTRIVMSNLPSATYFVKVIQNNKEVKNFKIIKY